MNSHCQPASPRKPWVSSSAPDTGPPITVASGTAAMNIVVTNQEVHAADPSLTRHFGCKVSPVAAIGHDAIS